MPTIPRKARLMSAHRKPVAPKTAAGIPADPILKSDTPPKAPPVLFRYAKALVALLVGEATAVTTWSVAIGTSHIDRTGWISLGAAVLGPMAAALGVAVTTNAQPTDSEAGHSSVGVMLFVVIFLAALLLGGFGSSWFFLLIVVALLALFL